MAVIELETLINAPVERCFLLSLSVDVHTLSTAHTQERAVAGITSGLMKLGDTVTWRARHFYSWQHLTSKITAYNFPSYFCDEMLSGAFESIRHEHHFIHKPDGTLMKDIFYFESPLGLLGKLANSLFLKKYMATLLAQRNPVIKTVAEGNEWKKFIKS